MAGFQGGYNIDIALVIDATGSMSPIINQVKANALMLGYEIKGKLDAVGKHVDTLRVRVIDFADFATEGVDAIHASEFFTLPEENVEFKKCVSKIECDCRGGDEPENALEALWVAMMSDWVDLPARAKARHIIVLLTDAPPLDLGERDGCLGYVAEDYPESIDEIENIWKENSLQGGMTKLNPRSKRLVLFAPKGPDYDGRSWKRIAGWENTVFIPVQPSYGLGEIDFDDIIDDILAEILISC